MHKDVMIIALLQNLSKFLAGILKMYYQFKLGVSIH